MELLTPPAPPSDSPPVQSVPRYLYPAAGLGKRFLNFLIPFESFSFLGATASGWHDSLSKTKVIDARCPPRVIVDPAPSK